jgi:hypothetical protein
MPHNVDGFALKFTGRRTWKAERRLCGKKLDIVPVALTKGRRQGASPKEVFLEVWYSNAEELEHRVADPNAFIVALAKAKDDRKVTPAFDSFVGKLSPRAFP